MKRLFRKYRWFQGGVYRTISLRERERVSGGFERGDRGGSEKMFLTACKFQMPNIQNVYIGAYTKLFPRIQVARQL